MKIPLSEAETRRCVWVGTERQLAAIAQGRRSYFVTAAGELGVHIVGALGEYAVAKGLGLEFWEPNIGGNDRAAGDVAGWHVRATCRPPGELVVRDHDPHGGRFVLVVGEPPCLTIAGWIFGREAHRSEWRRAPHGWTPAWFVPASELRQWEDR